MAKKVPIVQATFYNNNTKQIENCYPMTSAKGVVMSDGKTLEESFSDKADDPNVVHKSGDEEILGRKTFDDLRANGFCLSDEGDWNRWVSAFYSFLENKGIIQFGTEEDWSVILRNIADPEYENDAATKNYVDTKISSTEENLVHKDGFERITGRKQFQNGINVGLFNSLVANEDGVESGAWLDQNEDPAPFIVADPSADDHAATKLYVDEGLVTKQDTLTPGNGISIEGNVISSTIDSLITPITYAELVALRNSSSLVAGMQYRITDYACTTTQENTQSAGHPFDIIVTADSENTLNEEARAIRHEGDTYFADCDLSAWKIWYCLDNDATRFAWADSANGKGVIFRMIDEWNNDVPYDFKNIQFRRVDANTITVIRGQYYNDYSAQIESFFNSTKNTLPFKYQYLRWYDSTRAAQEGFADLLDMTEEEVESSGLFYCILDDKDWFGDPGLLASVESITGNNTKWLYTFNTKETFADSSLDGYTNNVFSNAVGVYLSEGIMRLNDICFFGNDCYYNTFGNNCNSNTFGNNCNSNTFGNNCYSNTFWHSCHSNTFENNCYSNTFGDDCYSNTFGDDCYYNIFGNNCYSNTFGNNCNSNTFGNNCYSNTFGHSCHSNTFGSACQFNTFGNNCYSNIFGSSCASNTFENNCYSNTFGNNCFSNTLGNNCSFIIFASSSSATTKYNYYQQNHFGDRCQYILFKGAETASSSAQVQNYNFAQGVQGTSSAYITIDGVRSRAYETKVAKNSSGELKIYCEADLIQ